MFLYEWEILSAFVGVCASVCNCLSKRKLCEENFRKAWNRMKIMINSHGNALSPMLPSIIFDLMNIWRFARTSSYFRLMFILANHKSIKYYYWLVKIEWINKKTKKEGEKRVKGIRKRIECIKRKVENNWNH